MQTTMPTSKSLLATQTVPFALPTLPCLLTPAFVTTYVARGPISNADATNKAYVDSVVRGLTVKTPVRLNVFTNTALTALVPSPGHS